jgi:hypothetical protein
MNVVFSQNWPRYPNKPLLGVSQTFGRILKLSRQGVGENRLRSRAFHFSFFACLSCRLRGLSCPFKHSLAQSRARRVEAVRFCAARSRPAPTPSCSGPQPPRIPSTEDTCYRMLLVSNENCVGKAMLALSPKGSKS